MIRILRDPYKISLGLATVFSIAVLYSAYKLYSLPSDLMLPSTFHRAMAPTYLAVAGAFMLGALAIYMALKGKKEIIVYKEKSLESQAEQDAAIENQKGTISLEGIKATLGQNKTGKEVFQKFMQGLSKQLEAAQSALYITKEENGVHKVALSAGYALNVGESASIEFEFGEGLVGQAAAEGQSLYVDDVPEGYIQIVSGLGSASPRYLLIVPVKEESNVLGVIEVASFTNFSNEQREFVEGAARLLAGKLKEK